MKNDIRLHIGLIGLWFPGFGNNKVYTLLSAIGCKEASY
jgi:hypothetical protein